jgi:hypothetical protein
MSLSFDVVCHAGTDTESTPSFYDFYKDISRNDFVNYYFAQYLSDPLSLKTSPLDLKILLYLQIILSSFYSVFPHNASSVLSVLNEYSITIIFSLIFPIIMYLYIFEEFLTLSAKSFVLLVL